MTHYHVDKPNFLELWVKMAKMTLKVNVDNPYFQYQPRVSHDACVVQIWWIQLKYVTSYLADKVKSTDGQMDRRTDAGNDNTLRPESQGIKFVVLEFNFYWNMFQLAINHSSAPKANDPVWWHILSLSELNGLHEMCIYKVNCFK